jgi:hypothetical protein
MGGVSSVTMQNLLPRVLRCHSVEPSLNATHENLNLNFPRSRIFLGENWVVKRSGSSGAHLYVFVSPETRLYSEWLLS